MRENRQSLSVLGNWEYYPEMLIRIKPTLWEYRKVDMVVSGWGPFFADYFAGAGPMAGVSYINEAPLENMRNTPFFIAVGEFDAAYGRALSGRQWKQYLDSTAVANPGQFIHQVDIQKGKGQGIDYFKTAPWLRQFTRNPYPDTLSFPILCST